MKTVIFFLLSVASVLGGETHVSLKSGETNGVSYGLTMIISDARSAAEATPGNNLVLTLRNNGSKWLTLDSVTAEDFSLHDAKGQEIKFYLKTPPKSIGYGDATVIHIAVVRAKEAQQPWTLQFKNKPNALSPVFLKIEGIEPRKRQ